MCTSFSRGARYLTHATSLRDARYLTSRGCRRPDGRRRSCSLLRVELNDELFLDLRVDLRADRQRVDQDAHLVGDDLQPGRHRALARFGLGHHERRHVLRLLPNLDDVVLGHPVGRDVDLTAVDRDVTVGGELTGHVPALGEAGPVDHVVQAALQDLEQVVAGTAVAAGGLDVVVVELPLQHPVHPASLLLLADLQEVFALLGAVTAVLARRVRPDLNRALRRVALRALQEQLHLLAAATLAVRASVSSHLLSLTPQTRRRFGGRQPLCGTGVTSWMEPTSRPVACSERMAVSRPEPGPLTNTSTLRMPCSMARRAAASAAICAANGVDLREPLNPTCPDDAQAMTAPAGSVMETMVLLNVLLMWACP